MENRVKVLDCLQWRRAAEYQIPSIKQFCDLKQAVYIGRLFFPILGAGESMILLTSLRAFPNTTLGFSAECELLYMAHATVPSP